MRQRGMTYASTFAGVAGGLFTCCGVDRRAERRTVLEHSMIDTTLAEGSPIESFPIPGTELKRKVGDGMKG